MKFLDQARIHVSGGKGGNGHHNSTSTGKNAPIYRGGDGGNGRIAFDAVDLSLTGAVTPDAGSLSQLDPADFVGQGSAGSFTSQIIDADGPTDWGTIGWEVYGGPFVEVRVRTSSVSDMSGAADFAAAPAVTLGQDLSTISSVADGHRYVQYEVRLSAQSPGSAPIFTALAINRQ